MNPCKIDPYIYLKGYLKIRMIGVRPKNNMKKEKGKWELSSEKGGFYMKWINVFNKQEGVVTCVV